jgi:flagella synthesis protein FlgN
MPAVSLLQQFNDDIASAERLLALLDSEYQALSRSELTLLEELLEEKQQVLTVLEQHRQQRSELLRGLQLTPDRAGLEALAQRSPQDSTLMESADALSDLLEHCQEANLRNGRLIQHGQSSVEGLLMIVRGKNDTAGLYNRRGQSTGNIARQRPINHA